MASLDGGRGFGGGGERVEPPIKFWKRQGDKISVLEGVYWESGVAVF